MSGSFFFYENVLKINDILADLAFGHQVNPNRVPMEGITKLDLKDVEIAGRHGYRIKLLCRYSRMILASENFPSKSLDCSLMIFFMWSALSVFWLVLPIGLP